MNQPVNLPQAKAPKEPYRVFFPLGVALAGAGTLIWFLFALEAQWGLGTSLGYARDLHRDIMAGGFLLAFSCGFLMTAVPRFTASYPARPWEVSMVWGGIALAAVLGFAGVPAGSHGAAAMALLVLALFYGQRKRAGQMEAPASFVWAEMALLGGAMGAVLLLLEDLQWLDGAWSLMGRRLYSECLILGLVLGVGSRLVPAILGHRQMPMRPPRDRKYREESRPWFLALLLLSSYGWEAWGWETPSRWLRVLLIGYVVFPVWRIHRSPRTKGSLPSMVWMAAWSLWLGFLGSALMPHLSIHMAHLAYVGGFGLLALMLASMVHVSHSGGDMYWTRSSKALVWIASLVLLSAATRAGSVLTGDTYILHLGISSLLWILALFLWSIVLFRVGGSRQD